MSGGDRSGGAMGIVRWPRPTILARVPKGGNAVIEASAGTGKTYTIENVLLELLLTTDASIEQILVVTFTEKATRELGARVRATLDRLLAARPDSATATPLADEECWILDDAARARLRRALHAFDLAPISTIHAFCQRVLTENAFAHRRLFDQTQVLDRQAFAAAFLEALRREFALPGESGSGAGGALRDYLGAWLEGGESVDSLEELLFACHLARGPLTPGFHPETLRAALDACAAVDVSEVALVPALKAARVHAATVKKLVGHLGALSQQVRICRDPLRPATFLIGAAEWLRYLREQLDQHPLPAGRAADALAAYAALARAAVPLEAAIAELFLPRVRARLERRKWEAGLFDFQDMLGLVADSLDGPQGDELARLLRARYRYALIDEFQDTDDVQWRIFRKLFFETNGKNPLYVIGDQKQAIYGFRGADVHTYLAAKREILDAGGSLLRLEENFRSTAAMIDAYNAILEQTADPPFFTGAIRYDLPVLCGDPTRAAVDDGGRPVAPIVLYRFEPAGQTLRAADVRRVLAVRIAEEIGRLLGPAPLRHGKGGQLAAVRARDIYILTRSANEGYEVGAALSAAGIPHAYYKQDGLFQTEEAEDVRDLLAAVADPEVRARRLAAWRTPFFGLNLEDLADCSDLPGTHPLVSRLLDWKALAGARDYRGLFGRIVADSGIVRREVFLRASERALTNYLHLFEVLLEEATRTGCTLGELVRRLGGWIEGNHLPAGDDGNVQRLESERDAVQIMSMHKAKGLEAAVVFLYGGYSSGSTGDRVSSYHLAARRVTQVGRAMTAEVKAAIERESDEEDQRLLYVALTRARARLYLPCFPARADGKEAFARLDGPYRRLNDRLRPLLARAGEPEMRRRFLVEPLLCPSPESDARAGGRSAPLRWTPPEALLAEGTEELDFDGLRARHAGFLVTSYSQLKRAWVERRSTPEPEAKDFAAERGADALGEPAPGELPGGAATGIFLHELLERVPLASLAGAPPIAEWRDRPEIRALFAETLRRHEIDPRHLDQAHRLVHTALTGPIRVGPIGPPFSVGRADAARVLREVEFLFPIPERFHPRLAGETTEDLAASGGEASAGDRFPALRGYIKGFMDLVFEHRGLTYFADWKSDRLAGWEPERIAAQVREHYGEQVQLYVLALLRMLDVRSERDYAARFGGVVYCFLRGMRPVGDGTAGVYFARPTWRDVRGWEEALTLRDDLGVVEGGRG